MRRKVLSVLLSTAMVASVLAGCGSSSADQSAAGSTDTAKEESKADKIAKLEAELAKLKEAK